MGGTRHGSAFVVRLSPGARARWRGATPSVMVAGRRRSWGVMPAWLARMVRRLAGEGARTSDFEAQAWQAAGAPGVTLWRALLSALEEQCAVCYEVRDARGRLGRLVPMAAAYRDSWQRAASKPSRPSLLSRFACLRRVASGLIVESPLAYSRVELEPRAVPILSLLAQGGNAGRSAGLSAVAVRELVAMLDAAGLLTAIGPAGRSVEDDDPVLGTWEHADLLFHSRSRLGRHDAPVGATFEYRGRWPALPAVKPPMARRCVPLPQPDLARLARTDPSFTRVLERRRSVRTPGRAPLTLAQLGEFLYRTARVRRLSRASRRIPYQTTSRPYPSGGACYPLEIYLAIGDDGALPRGLFHYDPRHHRLEPIAGGADHVEDLLRDAGAHGLTGGATPVLFMITARFARAGWKYRSIAYAVLLKDVGVLLQTMYLVATAMGLAPCAIGCGDADRSARAAGARFEEESSVGEFLLATLPAARAQRRPRVAPEA